MNLKVVVPSSSFGITKFGIAPEVRNFDELKCALIGFKIDNFIFEKEKKENFIRYMLYKFDGFSSKRLNDVVLAKH